MGVTVLSDRALLFPDKKKISSSTFGVPENISVAAVQTSVAADHDNYFNNAKSSLSIAFGSDKSAHEKRDKSKDVGTVPYPMSMDFTKKRFEDLTNEVKELQTLIPSWATTFKAEAQAGVSARDKVKMDNNVAKINMLQAYGNKVSKYADEIVKMYSEFVATASEQVKKYQEAKNKQEAESLILEAEKARALAEELDKKEEALKAQNMPVAAQAVANQSAQLNKIADSKEALAESKAPKSKLGIALALAAGAAAIIASQ